MAPNGAQATTDARLARPLPKTAARPILQEASAPPRWCYLPQSFRNTSFFGGQPIDVSFPYDTVKDHKKELAALISTYLQRGGLQFQVNAASSKALRAAYENPEAYPHLIVRVGGFSLYFNTLPDNAKLEFIERCEQEGN